MLSLKLFRSKRFAIAMSLLLFIFSCTTHGVDTSLKEMREINYSVFENFKLNLHLLDIEISQKNSMSTAEKSLAILEQINQELGTNVTYPYLMHELPDYYGEEIIKIGLTNEWINTIDVDLIYMFINDLKSQDFDYAMTNYENNILHLEVSDEKFEKLNFTANLIQTVNYENPNLFNNLQKTEDDNWLKCTLATLALASATAGLTSCATLAACGIAVALHLAALDNFGRACLSKLEPQKPQLNDQ